MPQTYDPDRVRLNAGALSITGFADGTFIKVTRTQPKNFTKKAGAHGTVARNKTTDRTGIIEFVLQKESPVNAQLQNLANSDASFPSSVIDGSSQKELSVASDSWIEEPPQPEYPVEDPTRTWMIGCADLNITAL